MVGSAPNRVASALRVLEGTFLRRAPKPGTVESQEYWSFRHPTLREGFATFIASNPNLMRVLIQGLDDDGILIQLDCGSGETKGTLITVPSSLFRLVAERVAKARPARRWEDWLRSQIWADFLASRCSRTFLEVYLSVDTELIDRCLRFGSYLSGVPDLAVLARLHSAGLLPEEQRLKALATVSDLAVETPDDGWLDNRALGTLFSDQDLAGNPGAGSARTCA